jgi:FkbM family methyltransferase
VIGRLRRAARARLGLTQPPPPGVAEVEIQGGPLAGRRLHVPAPGSAYFARVAAGTEDVELWQAAGQLDAAAVRVVFDVGGYVGMHALAWASLFPEARVVTFEPARTNRVWLTRNLTLNPDLARRIAVEPVCAADFEGSAPFRTTTNIGAGHSSSSTLAGTANDRISPPDLIADLADVPVTTLDAASARHGQPQVVKIDVENAEPAVLRGAAGVLPAVELLLCEVHTPGSMFACARLLGAETLTRTIVLKEEPDGRVFLSIRRR